MKRRVAGPVPRRTLIVRGVVFTVVAVVVGVLLVGRGAGLFDRGATVSAVLPAAAGRIPVNAPVHHLGVKVGDVRSSEGASRGDGDDDEPGTRIEMLIGSDHADRIPANVVVRAVPRTLFGDVRLDLVSPGGPAGTAPGATSRSFSGGATLTGGEELHADTSDEAVLLYDVFTRASDLLAAIEPERMQVTLTALAQALDGRGETLGRTIEDADRAGEALDPAMENAAAASGGIALLTEDLASASPEIVETLEEATRLSRVVLDRPGALGKLLDAGLSVGVSGVHMADRTVPGAIRLVHDTGVVFDYTARNPHGVLRTLEAMRPMGEAGAAAFATGKFDITAVPSFADPIPYGPEDCPRYPELAGSTCTGASSGDRDPGFTVNAATEREMLRELQATAADDPGSPVPPPEVIGTDPATAAWTMLGPLVRGNEVTIR